MSRLLTIWHSFLRWLGAAPEAPALPPIKHVDQDGVGWTQTPDLHEPWHEDIGQHDTWKREMRIWLWHSDNPSAQSVDLRDLGLSVSSRVQPLPLAGPMPMPNDLAAACRRLGFQRLVRASGDPRPQELLYQVYLRHEAAVLVEAERRYTVNTERAKTWNPAHGSLVFDKPSQTSALLSAGSWSGPWESRPFHTLDVLKVRPEMASTDFTRRKHV